MIFRVCFRFSVLYLVFLSLFLFDGQWWGAVPWFASVRVPHTTAS